MMNWRGLPLAIPYTISIDTLRRFRHAFSNMYQAELDPRRLGILNDDLPGILDDFKVWHEKSTAALSLIAAGEAEKKS